MHKGNKYPAFFISAIDKTFFFLSFFKAPEKEEKKAVELNRPFPKLSSTSDVQVSPL